MQPLTLRPYRGDDEAALLRLWNQCLPHDPLDAPTFRYYDYYDALGTLRGCLGGFPKAVGLMAPGAGLRRLSYLPGLEPGEMINLT